MRPQISRKVVFLGPTLALAEARGICPDAEFHPPVRFGDLYALSCETPGQVLIVDGVFHDATPVWQREILRLLQADWQVLGASSMGALRALELEPYGMIGLGTIFEWYRSGRIEGDDEVALLHGDADMGYRAQTLPLVDVRHTLARLEVEGWLAAGQVSSILHAFKHMGHEERTLRALLELVETAGADPGVVRAPLSDRAQSLKAQDARMALAVLAGRIPPPITTMRWPDPTPSPVQPEAVLYRRIYPLVGPPIRVTDVLNAMKQCPDELLGFETESRRHWFLNDWTRAAGKGPLAQERRCFAVRHAGGLAKALGISLPRWCAASALRDQELEVCMAGLTVEDWLGGRTAEELGIARPRRGEDASLIPLILADWMRRHGAEAPPEAGARAADAAAWLIRKGPAYFGARDFHPDVALTQALAASGSLARWGRTLRPSAQPGKPA